MSISEQLPARIRRQLVFDHNGCWIWQGFVAGRGDPYGATNRPGSSERVYVHRLVYELLVGPIPDNHELHHKCYTRLCANPDHLQPLTHLEHMQLENNRYVCAMGHEKQPGHHCKICNTLYARKRGQENIANGLTWNGTIRKPEITHCKHHGELLYVSPKGRKYCKLCHLANTNRWRANNPRQPLPKPTLCKRGHPYEGNRAYSKNGSSYCRSCNRENMQRRRRQRR